MMPEWVMIYWLDSETAANVEKRYLVSGKPVAKRLNDCLANQAILSQNSNGSKDVQVQNKLFLKAKA
ncbi:MAG: hypothetical protein DRP18_03855 [Candidatus Aenigmatarchaeota archaeon]|nr:MAG: hypothetical protein DRP18_03855 [Candidatus Aenigmarchaeota archaeon]